MSQGQTLKYFLLQYGMEKKNGTICEILTVERKTSFLFISSGDISPYNLPVEMDEDGRRRKGEGGADRG